MKIKINPYQSPESNFIIDKFYIENKILITKEILKLFDVLTWVFIILLFNLTLIKVFFNYKNVYLTAILAICGFITYVVAIYFAGRLLYFENKLKTWSK